MEKKYNMRSPGVKRLMREAIELKDPTSMYFAQPLDDNLFEWHFTILGPKGTEYEGGIYHGRILLPTEYPMKPPSIIMLTPNGRFELGQKICLSASSYHPELWQPSWSIRTVLLAMIGFMPTEGVGAIGSLDCLPEERKRLARRSVDWVCQACGVANKNILLKEQDENSQEKAMAEAADIVSQMAFKSEEEVKAQKKQLSQKTKTENQDKQSSLSPQAQTNSNPPATSTSQSSSISQPPSDATTTKLRQRNTSTNTSTPPSTSQTDGTTPSGGDRATTTNQGFVSMVPPTVRQATLQPADTVLPHRSRGWGSLFLIWVLLLTIATLLARRIYNMAVNS